MDAMPMRLRDDFLPTVSSHWQRLEQGKGRLWPTGGTLRLVNEDTSERAYSNAQIDDYHRRSRGAFLWRPPLVLTVRARFSHPGYPGTPGAAPGEEILSGTAGFGFWNDPLLLSRTRLPVLPRAIWFFYSSPPSNMKLALQTPGPGWKAAMLDAQRLPAALLAPAAPPAMLLMKMRPLYRRLWPLAQRVLNIAEAALDLDMTGWHTYRIEWLPGSALFTVDDRVVLAAPMAPRGPLGLVIWLDNQYLVATPWGQFRYGYLAASGRQWLELDRVEVNSPLVI